MKDDVVATVESASVARTCIEYDPTVVGVPEITPVDVFKDNPGGKVPITEYVFDPTPPVAETVREYGVAKIPVNPVVGVVIASAGNGVACAAGEDEEVFDAFLEIVVKV